MNELFQLYRDRLTDLTARNKSLRLMRLTNKNHCDVHDIFATDEEPDLTVLQDIFSLKSQVPLLPFHNEDEDKTVLSRKLTYLKREIDLIEQETGSNTFYIAYGFLEGYLVEDFYIRSPILFYPAKFVRKNIRNNPFWVVEMDEENTPFINRTLILALRKFKGVNIEQQQSEGEIPKENLLEYIMGVLNDFGLSVNTDTNEIIAPFRSLKKDDLPKEQKGFILRPYMVMGKFQQSTSTLLQDYEHLIANNPTQGLLEDLLNNNTSEDDLQEIRTEELNRVHEEETFFVLNTDASQEAAVVSTRDRNGIIVQGPPGTGKSQVIVNLISDRLARGERVLLVCQKPVALEVVYNRLGSINLQQHVAFVADYNASKRGVYGKIATILQNNELGNSVDTSHKRVSNEMQALSIKLNNIAETLHKERHFGKSLYYLYNHASWDQKNLIDVRDLLEGTTYQTLQEHMVELNTILDLMQKYDHPDFPWVSRKSFSKFTVTHERELKELLDQLVQDVQKASEIRISTELHYPPEYYLKNRTSIDDLKKAVSILQNRNMFKHVLMFYHDDEREFENEDHLNKVKQAYGLLQTKVDLLSSRPEPTKHLTEQEAKMWSRKIDQFVEVNKKFMKIFNGSWYSLKKEIKEHCEKHNVIFEGGSVRKYREEIDSFLLFEDIRKESNKIHFFSDAPSINDIEEWSKWIRLKKHALDFLDLYVTAQTTFPKWLVNLKSQSELEVLAAYLFESQLTSVADIIAITERCQHGLEKMRSYVQDDEMVEFLKQVNNGIYDITKYESINNTIVYFDSMNRLDQLKEDMGDFRKKLIDRCAGLSPIGETPNIIAQWKKIIENSFLHAWILDIEDQEPHIKDVSTEIYNTNLNRYATLLKDKRKLVPSYITNQLRRQSTEIQRQSHTKLKAESTKKRTQASLHQIMGSFMDDVLKLIPCWLCTPDAVSAIFPMIDGLFDLVIFDEASQCPVENAIPAIYRGKKLVIAGDEKQLPPTSFFQSKSEEDLDEEDEDNTVYKDNSDKTAASLLEWGKPRFADQWLTWHYRSKHDALINFSNYAFYGERMQIAPVAKPSNGKPIEFIQVDGRWINNQNRLEAEKVVDTVLDILKNDSTNPTLGIITFNSKQAELINDIFEERGKENPDVQYLIEQARQRKEDGQDVSLFVKNIENVQGDERDIILFSVAYAKNEEGKMPSTFSHLSQEGGENRLNVAITRAKSKIYLACSFEPSEWVRAETYARGVRLLKRYLEYGKAVSENDQPRIKMILEGLLEGTETQNLDDNIKFDSVFEIQVFDALRERDYKVHTQVGFSGYRIDLGVIHPDDPDHYILGIECDGATYHSSKVARERDLYRQRFLESHGWKIHRIWSRNWWKAREQEMDKLIEVIKSLSYEETAEITV